MSYAAQLAQLKSEYRSKQRTAQFAADAYRQAMLERFPELDEADTQVREAILAAARSPEGQKALERARQEFDQVLKKIGLTQDAFEPHYECPDCRDTGKGPNGGYCRCLLQKLFARVYSEANLNTEQTFDRFDLSVFPETIPQGATVSQRTMMSNALKKAREYAQAFPDNQRENIVLLGSTGVGKSFLANCIARSVLERGYTVLSTTAFGLFDSLSARLSGADIDTRHIREADLLVIDDLGMEPMYNNFTIENLFAILDDRLRLRKPFILTSNLSVDELQRRYTERITSRLFDRRHTLPMHLPGEDIRCYIRGK